MRTQHDGHHPDLSANSLPGPDTATKLAAIKDSYTRFQYMLTEAGRTGWPEAFTEDLYLHDLQVLKENPSQPMLWILRRHGTHLYPLAWENAHEAAYCRQVIRYWSGEHKLNTASTDEERAKYYIVSETGLEEISADEAAERVKVRAGE